MRIGPTDLGSILATATFLVIHCFSTSAQILQGIIIDDQNSPVVAANIYLNKGQRHTHTNELGNFAFTQAQPGDTLHISSLGFNAETIVLTEIHFEGILRIPLTETIYQIGQVVISDNSSLSNQLMKLDLQANPVTSSQEILQKVPGLIIGQHAGGGKAEQLFLRGFDLDHGTDIHLSVDGMPVNMVSHAHGQGYADLHFLIPEIVDRIEYLKGPYQSDAGNFATAGQVAFYTKDKLQESSLNIESGRYNTLRLLGLFDLFKEDTLNSGYLAIDQLQSDGPFESSQNLHRLNIFGKFTHKLKNGDRLWISASRFSSSWTASGQIPQRAVDQKIISRFGAIDDTEGGTTGRTNLAMGITKNLGNRTFLKTTAYFVNYDFELYSNFTFFLNDPINGDQIRQKEKRNILGFDSKIFKESFLGNNYFSLEGGFGLRNDQIDNVELSHTQNRYTTLQTKYLGDILETNLHAFISGKVDFGNLTLNPSLRADHFNFDYSNQLSVPFHRKNKNSQHLSPQLTLSYSTGRNWQHFFKVGKGFHSNDTRSIVTSTSSADSGFYQSVPSAYGIDLGTTWSPSRKIIVTSALWHLLSEQEFVYVGDEGIIDVNGRSQRMGWDFGIRTELGKRIFAYLDYNYARARSINEPKGEDRIPLAPEHTASGGLTFRSTGGFSAGARFIYLGDRPANENYSLTAEGYFRVDANLQYDFKHFSLGIVVQNLFDTKWNETQFATRSRLKEESESAEEIHFTPGTPFTPRFKISYRF